MTIQSPILAGWTRCSRRWPTRPGGASSTSSSGPTARRLTELEARFPMTRFGVMKHLKQLEEAGLVVTQAARPGEAPLLEPRPDPARPRPVGEQVRRTLGRRAQRTQAGIGASDGEGVRDLHQDHARAALGGPHRPGRSGRSTTSAPAPTPTGHRARASSSTPRRPTVCSARARCSRSIPRGASCTP